MGKKKRVQVTYKIESGIPIAPTKRAKSRFPFAEMKEGDSFFIPSSAFKNFNSARQSIYASSYAAGVKVRVRQVEGGLRVWMIEKVRTKK